jgi:hypothetical protein
MLNRDLTAMPREKIVVVVADGKGLARQKARARYKEFVPVDVVRMDNHTVEGRKNV